MQAALPPKAPRHLRRYFLFGILFEFALIALALALPDSWLQVESRNFLIITHNPFLMLLGIFDDSILVLFVPFLYLAVIGAVWGFLIYWAVRLASGLKARYVVTPRQRLAWKCGLGLTVVALLSLVLAASFPAGLVPFTASPEVKDTVDGNTAFAMDLYQSLKAQPGNLFFSPYSLSTALAMTYAGARGQTADEMAAVLHFNPARTNLPASFAELATRMDAIQRWNRNTLLTANSLWGQQNYRFTDSYLNLVRDFYRGEVQQVDFVHAAPAAAQKINGWISRSTKGKIQSAVQPEQFNDYTRLVLCNAIYFKGKWLHPFKARETKPDSFRVSTNETVTVPMMRQEGHFKMTMSDDQSIALLELPYVGTDLSMIILLPQTDFLPPDVENPGLPDLEKKFTAENLHLWLAKLQEANPHETWVVMPRFTTSQTFDLAEELKSLGMKSAFEQSTANFSGMDGTTNLLISGVIHKSFGEVNESGTEAAAVSVAVVATAAKAGEFIVDHPFIFLIRDNGSGSILFIGLIVDPTK